MSQAQTRPEEQSQGGLHQAGAGLKSGPQGEPPSAQTWRRIGIFSLALSLRLLYLFLIQHTPFFDSPIVDAQTYDEQAQAIAQGQLGPDGAYWQPPLYPLLLGGFYALFGRELLWVRVVQAIVGALTCTLAAELSARRAGALAGWATGIALACYGPLIFFDGELLVPVLSLFLDMLALFLLYPLLGRSVPQPRSGSPDASAWQRPGLSGLVLGFSAIARPTILLFAGWAGIRLLLSTDRPPQRGALRLGWALAFGAGLLLPILPVTAWNMLKAHEPVLISSNGGVNFYLGNHPQMLQVLAIRPGLGWKALMRQPQEAGIQGDAAISQWWIDQTLALAKAEPGSVLRNLGTKLLFVLEAFERYRNVDMTFFQEQFVPSLRFTLGWGLLLPLALLGRLTGRGRRDRALLDGFLAAQLCGLLLFFVVARYRLSLVPVLAIYAGEGVQCVALLLRRARAAGMEGAPLHTLRAPLAALLVLIPLMHWDPTGTQHVDPAEGFNLVGQAHSNQGRRAEAVAAFQRALQVQPGYIDAVFNLGREYQLMGDCSRALPLYLRALEHYPKDRDVLSNTGVCELALEQRTAGLTHLEEASQLYPGQADVHFNLAQAYAQERRYPEALKILTRALALHPTEVILLQARQDWEAALGLEQQLALLLREPLPTSPDRPLDAVIRLNNEGHVLLRERALEEALSRMVRCLTLSRGYAVGWLNLGQVLYASTRVAEAEQAFSRALVLQPGYPAARLGQALCLSRIPGRTQEAVLIAQGLLQEQNPQVKLEAERLLSQLESLPSRPEQ